MKLRKLNNRDYELTLIGTANQMKVKVNPVLTGADYQKAMTDFNQSFAKYETALADREEQLQSAREVLLREIADRKRIAKMNYDKRISTLKSEGKNNKVTEEMIKYRVVNNFTRNTVAKFYAKKGTEVQYSRNSKKLLWVVTKENKLAVYRPEKLKRLRQKKISARYSSFKNIKI